jgi:hypothetical protein
MKGAVALLGSTRRDTTARLKFEPLLRCAGRRDLALEQAATMPFEVLDTLDRDRVILRLGDLVVDFVLLWLLPINFSYAVFALVLFIMGLSFGLFASPNRAAVMNSLPPADRGAGGAMNQTLQNSAQVLSVGIFFWRASLPGRQWVRTSVDHNALAGNHRSGVRDQHPDDGSHVLGAAQAFEGLCRIQLSDDIDAELGLDQSRAHVGYDKAGGDDVDADAVVGLFLGERERECFESRLSHIVWRTVCPHAV